MERDVINIVLCTDSKTMSGIEALIYSTMFHNFGEHFHWYIYTMQQEMEWEDVYNGHREMRRYDIFNDFQTQWLKFFVHFMDKDSKLDIINCTHEYNKIMKGMPSENEIHGFAPHIGIRLMLDMLLPQDVHKCILFDTDMIVQGKIRPLWDNYITPEDDFAAYVLPHAGKNGRGELNAGTMVFNLDHIRWSGMLNRARIYYINEWYRFPEQGVLEEVGKPVLLPDLYNYFSDHRMATIKPTVLHFTDQNKCKAYPEPVEFYRYYPEHKYIYNGVEQIKSVFESTLNYKERKRREAEAREKERKK